MKFLYKISGVADGVGGWRNYGIDPSAFPKSLMETCERMVREGRFNAQAPATVIAASYYEVQQMKTPLIGIVDLATITNFLEISVVILRLYLPYKVINKDMVPNHHFTTGSTKQHVHLLHNRYQCCKLLAVEHMQCVVHLT